ncbi:ABC transporter substrate-binding protein [Paenibacillus baekrokdamisoli]|uniref:ABC transporter substrate-binding protein n=1 Tax=Paenibacillus baekrokdamisoli TaxID=1712516 RepID=A0A3G9J6S8_9BACL|nr:ABC transporter substrate-binding protein [Paenibacillus baekrokdamisoli]MBB3072485.1 putative aldouronate transport system substrate-binding protein [Paenibacillus baekrokdamisoli]BBH20543.1 ABC transporter substrate-binding protein [Paenibacillus baekrokdamisoli]
MRNKRGILASLMSVALVSTVLTACTTGTGKSTESEDSKTSGTNGKVEKVVIAMPSFNKIPDDMSSINDAINKITTKKINVQVDFKVYGPADYGQKVNLALQSGEQLDLFTSPGQFPSYAAKKQLYPLEDLINKYGQETKAILDKDFGDGLLKATSMNGHIYGIPANKGMSIPINFVYNADMLKETGFTADDIKSVNDLPKIFDAVMKKHPDVVPFAPINVNPSDTNLVRLLRGTNDIDLLTDESGVGVVVGNGNKVVNLYETDIFRNGVNMMRDWYNKGYLQKDAATTSTSYSDLASSGRGFSTLGGYSGMEASKALSAQTGKNIAMKRIAPFYFDTQAVDFVVWMMSSTTEVPEAAMKFLNLIYTDKDLLNTMLYGIEGRDYVKVDDHHVKYPDGKDASTVPYTAQLSSGILGSESLQYALEGTDWKDTEFKLKENKETKRSPYFGFIFDQSSVKTELSAVNNVINQYIPGLITGVLDPDKTIPKFVKALNDAGAQIIIQKKQEQLDKWIAEQKK